MQPTEITEENFRKILQGTFTRPLKQGTKDTHHRTFQKLTSETDPEQEVKL